jgi:cyclohexyl-isocyanide hydratase
MTAPKPSTGIWNAGVLLFDGVEPLDAFGPAQVLWSLPQVTAAVQDMTLPSIEVHLVAPTLAPVITAYGMVVHPTVGYDDCPPLDLLVVPGGGRSEAPHTRRGVAYFQDHAPTVEFVRSHAASGRILASVCTGAFILAGAGVLAGRRTTTHWYARKALTQAMAEREEQFELVEERVVDDGDLVTAGGVSAGIDLGLHLIARCFGSKARHVVELVIEHDTPTGATR